MSRASGVNCSLVLILSSSKDGAFPRPSWFDELTMRAAERRKSGNGARYLQPPEQARVVGDELIAIEPDLGAEIAAAILEEGAAPR